MRSQVYDPTVGNVFIHKKSAKMVAGQVSPKQNIRQGQAISDDVLHV